MMDMSLNPVDLTSEQVRVVNHTTGPAVVIACPGSGKTRALTHRIAHLIRQHGVSPAAILGITFTRAAAAEMKDRLTRLLPPGTAVLVRLHTFHALAWSIIRQTEGRPQVLDEAGQQAIARQLLREFNLNADQTAVKDLLTDFGYFVGAQISSDRFHPVACEQHLFFDIWTRYGRLKAEAGLSDFDDLILRALAILRDNPLHQQRHRERTQHLLVDEFQDTNTLQWQFLQMLLPAGNNIMVVGDDDQAIYGWRGSSPSFMLDFPHHFPGCAELRLTRNFRSAATIVDPAGRLIAANSRRFSKSFIAVRPAAQPPAFIRPVSPAEEADMVTAAIRGRLAAGADPAELAVLYRIHLMGFPLMTRLERAGIPFRVLGESPNPFTRWMTRDVLAYLRWAHGEASLDEIARVLMRPYRRGISKELAAEVEQQTVAPAGVLHWLAQRVTPAGARELLALGDHLKKLAHLPAGAAISFIRHQIGYDAYIDWYCSWSGSDPAEARDVLSVVEQVPEADESSRVFIDLAGREERRGEPADTSTPCVTLSSFHGSKGLEWADVWILAAVEGAIPYRRVIENGSPEAMEEERRLFYVGMTRAKDVLTISAPRTVIEKEVGASRFVIEAGIWSPPQPPVKKKPARRAGVSAPDTATKKAQPALPALPREDYAPGIVCVHTRFGEGVIHRINESAGTLEFRVRQNGEVRLLSIQACVSRGFLRSLLPPGAGTPAGAL